MAQVVLGDQMETTESTHPEDVLLDILHSNQNSMQPLPGHDTQVRDKSASPKHGEAERTRRQKRCEAATAFKCAEAFDHVLHTGTDCNLSQVANVATADESRAVSR